MRGDVNLFSNSFSQDSEKGFITLRNQENRGGKMDNQIQVFNFQDSGVRVIVKGNEPLFCLADICATLEIKNRTDLKNAIDKEFDKGGRFNLYPLETKGGKQNFSFISEPELYFVLMRSDKPQAKPFRKWVVNDVLPSIRKNGGYIANQENLSDTELMARALIVAQNVINNKDKIITEQKQVIEYQESKLDGYKEVEKSRRSKAILAKKLNQYVRIIANQKFNGSYQEAYNYIYNIFSEKHFITEKINIDYLKKNMDYLQECVEIALSEMD